MAAGARTLAANTIEQVLRAIARLGRQLELKVDLMGLTRDYVLNLRRNIRGARKHDFLFVSSCTGAAPTTSRGCHPSRSWGNNCRIW